MISSTISTYDNQFGAKDGRWTGKLLRRNGHIFNENKIMCLTSRVSTFLFHPTASYGFIEDVLAQGKNDPLVRVDDGSPLGLPTEGAPLKLTLLRCTREFRNYGAKKQPCSVFKLVVCDGSQIMFSAVLNSGLDWKLRGTKFPPGCQLTINRYNMLWMESGFQDEFKLVMFIHDFDFCLPPARGSVIQERQLNEIEYYDSEDDSPPEKAEMHVDNNAIDHVQSTYFISHLEPVLLESGLTVWKLANSASLHRTGVFIIDDECKLKYLQRKSESDAVTKKSVSMTLWKKDTRHRKRLTVNAVSALA